MEDEPEPQVEEEPEPQVEEEESEPDDGLDVNADDFDANLEYALGQGADEEEELNDEPEDVDMQVEEPHATPKKSSKSSPQKRVRSPSKRSQRSPAKSPPKSPAKSPSKPQLRSPAKSPSKSSGR